MGMPNIVFRCQMFRGDWDQVWSQMRMLWLMEGLCRVNQTHLRQFDEFKKRGLIENSYPTVYGSGLHYETEKGTEIWPDIPSLLMGTMGKGVYPGPWGDCLPVATAILNANHTVDSLLNLKIGNRIVGDNEMTTVTNWSLTGEKPILDIRLDNDSSLRCSPEHRIFSSSGEELRAEVIKIGDRLKGGKGSNRVIAIKEDKPELCCDITTDTGRFYLPESDTIVHNCEDLACYRVAELRELPWHYERIAPWKRKKDDGKPNIEMADPRFPQGDAERAASAAKRDWPGWKKVKGGIPSKPFAKWRRGPQGNYHYHALTLIPDGRLEDPSLVLGMGKEAAFAEADTANKLKNAEVPVVIQYAKAPDVMVVDPEKPSGYNGGVAIKLDKDVLALMATKTDLTAGDPEMGAYLSNSILLGDGEFDVDAIIGWSRDEKRFIPKSDTAETKRLLGYARH
jgi:hypothetical protein